MNDVANDDALHQASPVVWMPPGVLKPHPRNYRIHPAEQLDHIAQSIREHGFYRNIVVANDNTILAGHGVIEAVQRMGLFAPPNVPVIQLPIGPDDPRALKVLTGDNEISKLAEIDDRSLTSILRELYEGDELEGTGFDGASLSALVFVSRPIEEVHSKNEAAEWVGMPEYDTGKQRAKLLMFFRSDEDRAEFVKKFDIKVVYRTANTTNTGAWTAWWPAIDQIKTQGLLFTDEAS